MLKRITFIIVFGLAAISAKAQFAIEDDTLHAYGYAGTSPSDFIDIEAETKIYHLSGSAERIKWVRTLNQLPDMNWSSAVCDIVACRSAEVDTGSFVFNPNDSGYLYFHFYTKNVNASGKMVVRFSMESDPLEFTDVVIFATAWKPVGITPLKKSVTVAMPNPAKNVVTFTNSVIENGEIEILNALGQVVLNKDYTQNMQIDLADLASGIYTIRISDGTYMSVSRIIKE